MVIYLRHPVHGTKVAISREEAAYDKGLGWEEFDPTASAVEKPVNTFTQLDHDGDGRPGGSLPGERSTAAIGAKRRGRPPKQ